MVWFLIYINNGENNEKKLLLIAVITTTLTACATDDPNKKTKWGAAIGVLTGAVIGHAVDDDKGALVGKAALQTGFMPTLEKVSNILIRYPHTVIHVVGHTDSVGSESYNMDLSRHRAQSVVNYVALQDIPPNRLVTVGRGEGEPRAGNDTSEGRQLNRRVEIYVKPIIEGQETEAFQTPVGV